MLRRLIDGVRRALVAIVEAFPARVGQVIPAVTDTGGLIRAGITLRSGGAALNGLTVAENRYVFLSATSSGAVKVRWFVDGQETSTDLEQPFDLEGSTPAGDPIALRQLVNGDHIVSALFTKSNGDEVHVKATFTVAFGDGDGGSGPWPPGQGTTVRLATGVNAQGSVGLLQDQLGRQLGFRLGFVGWRGLTWQQWLSDVDRALNDYGWRAGNWTLILSVPPLPDPAKVPGVSLAQGAAGAYDAFWDAFGDKLNALPAALLDRIVLAFFREDNAQWYPWATEPKNATQTQINTLIDQKVAYHQRIVTRIRAKLGTTKAGRLLFEWTPNGPPANTAARAANIRRGYPGDAYVDIIGMDYYTNSDALKAGFSAALKWFIDFAGSKGKLWAITETSTGGYIEMAPGWAFSPTWSASTTYSTAQSTPVVFSEDRFWRARATNTGIEPGTDPAIWAPTLEHKGAYSPSSIYAKGDIVEYAFVDWRCDIDGTLNVTPTDNAEWTPAFSGPLDYPQYATDLVNGMVYAATRPTGSVLHHANLWEIDVPRERLWASAVCQKKTLPGREAWRVGRVDVTIAASSPTVTAVGRKDWFDTSDIGQLLVATGIPSGATILAVAADGRTATMSANATATGARVADHGGIPKPNYLTNYPRTARRLIRLLGGPAT